MANKYKKKANYLNIENKWYKSKYKEMDKEEYKQMLFEMAQGTNQAVNQNYKRATKYGVRTMSMGKLEVSGGADKGTYHASIPRNASERQLEDIIDRNLKYLRSIEDGGVKKVAERELADFNLKLGRQTKNERPKGLTDYEWEKKRPMNYEERETLWKVYNEITGHSYIKGSPVFQQKIGEYITTHPNATYEEIYKYGISQINKLSRRFKKSAKDIRRRR